MRKTTRMLFMQNGVRRNQENEGGYDRPRPIGYEREDYEPEMRRGRRPGGRRRMEPRMGGDDEDWIWNHHGKSDEWEMMPGGRARGYEDEDVDFAAWIAGLKNADGSTGAHWSKQKAEELRIARNVMDVEPEAFYITINMLYSDYQPVFKKFGVDRPEVYAEMAKAFLTDKDSKQGMDKLEAYYCYVVK